jgi:hypothetical protein
VRMEESYLENPLFAVGLPRSLSLVKARKSKSRLLRPGHGSFDLIKYVSTVYPKSWKEVLGIWLWSLIHLSPRSKHTRSTSTLS